MPFIPEGDSKLLIKYLDTLYKEGSLYRDEFSKGWDRAVKVAAGDVWPDKRPSYKVDAAMNFLGQILEKKTAQLTDGRPTINILSRKEGLDGACKILLKVAEGVLEEINLEQRLTEAISLDQYFGLVFTKVPFDGDAFQGLGAIDIEVCDPRTCIFDPFIKRTYNVPKGEYFCHEDLLPTDMLKEKYHDNHIKPDSGGVGDGVVGKIRQFFGYKGMTTKTSSVIDRSILRDWWIMDRTTRKDGELVFKGWRHIRDAGGCIVVDDSNPYIDETLPYDGMDWTFDPNTAYGRNEVSQLENPQILFDKLLALTVENSTAMSNAVWIGDYDALSDEDWKRLSNAPGAHVRTRPGKNLRREGPPALPGHIAQVLSMLSMGLKELGSDTEVSSGRKPGSVTSGAGIEMLQLASSTLIRMKARQMEYLIDRIGQKIVARILQYYTDDRVFNTIGDSNDYQQFTFHRRELLEAIDHAGTKHSEAYRLFQFKVTPSSSLAMTKWQKGLVATQLYQLGAIDREALLDALEYPDRDAILRRTIEKQKAGIEPVGVKKGSKLPKGMMKGGGSGGHKELALQHPQG